MWDTLKEWWENYFDRLSWMGVGLIIGVIGSMLYLHHTEVGANIIKQNIPVAPVNRSEPKLSPEMESMLKQTTELWEKKDYKQVIDKANLMLSQNPKEPSAYLFLARAYREMNDTGQSIVNYSQAVKFNPDFVDKKCSVFLGRSKYYGKELKPYVDKAIAYSQSPEFNQRPDKDKILKEIYYLQRRLAGGCE